MQLLKNFPFSEKCVPSIPINMSNFTDGEQLFIPATWSARIRPLGRLSFLHVTYSRLCVTLEIDILNLPYEIWRGAAGRLKTFWHWLLLPLICFQYSTQFAFQHFKSMFLAWAYSLLIAGLTVARHQTRC